MASDRYLSRGSFTDLARHGSTPMKAVEGFP